MIAVAALLVAGAASLVATCGASAPLLAALGGTISASTVVATASSVATTAAIVGASTATAAVVNKQIEEVQTQTYSVYFLEDANGTIRYVGRVKDEGYRTRMAHHKATRNLTPAHRISGLRYSEARGLEEIGIMTCHTLNATNPVNNQIHGIGANNKNGSRYMQAAMDYLLNRRENWLLNRVF